MENENHFIFRTSIIKHPLEILYEHRTHKLEKQMSWRREEIKHQFRCLSVCLLKFRGFFKASTKFV